MELSALDNREMSRPAIFLLGVVLCFASSVATYAQSSSGNSGTIRGTVLDPSGAAIVGATVEIENPVSHYRPRRKTDNQGNFDIRQYSVQQLSPVSDGASGFQAAKQDVDVRSPIPVASKDQPEHRHCNVERDRGKRPAI